MKCESVTQEVLLHIEPMLRNAKRLQHARLSQHVRCRSFLDSINNFLREVLGLPALFRAEHYQSLEIALANVG
jgi:enamine deaminase RidA (YjgF/YER057c/UK114 family)